LLLRLRNLLDRLGSQSSRPACALILLERAGDADGNASITRWKLGALDLANLASIASPLDNFAPAHVASPTQTPIGVCV
jgi:hypothetical protein